MASPGDLSDLSGSGDLGSGPVGPPSRGTSGGLVFAAGLVATVALVVALVALWPDGDDTTAATEDATATTILTAPEEGPTTSAGAGTGEPSAQTSTTAGAPQGTDLFGGDLPAAVGDLVAAAGGPAQAISLSIYPDYAFLAYRDPGAPENIDRRLWRGGQAGEASPNPIDDRVDADTEPALFPIAELDLSVLPALVADAATRYDRPVTVTHVIVDRFLPFDERVLWRVYATPSDGRSGGGYVSYDAAGAFVSVCC